MSSISVVVGGPPHSGKSTFSVRLVRSLRKEHGLDAKNSALDPYDHSTELNLKMITEEERLKLKKHPEETSKIITRFMQALVRHDLVVGDLPGDLDDIDESLVKVGRYGIILCKSDETHKIPLWEKVFFDNDIQTIAILTTSKAGNENIYHDKDGIIRGNFVGLERGNVVYSSTYISLGALLITKLDL